MRRITFNYILVLDLFENSNAVKIVLLRVIFLIFFNFILGFD